MGPLPKEARKYIGLADPSNLEGLYLAASQWVRAENIGDGDFSSIGTQPRMLTGGGVDVSTPMDLDMIQAQLAAMGLSVVPSQGAPSAVPAQHAAPAPTPHPASSQHYFNAANTSASPRPQSSSRGRACYRCGHTNHLRRDCRAKRTVDGKPISDGQRASSSQDWRKGSAGGGQQQGRRQQLRLAYVDEEGRVMGDVPFPPAPERGHLN